MSKIRDITNIKFGHLLMLEVAYSKNRKRFWKCLCDCGNITFKNRSDVVSGNTSSCGCINSVRPSKWKGCYEISGAYLYKIKKSARKRQIEFSIDDNYLWEKYLSQDRKCAISGIEIVFTRNMEKRSHLQTASIDRIDPKRGYINNNIQWVHKDINLIKWKLDEKKFLYYINLITNPIVEKFLYNQPYINSKRFSMYKNGAKRRNIDFCVSLDYIKEIFIKQNGRCLMTGIPLSFDKVNDYISASLDRVDNLKGYIVGNVRWVHTDINMMRNNMDNNKFLEYCYQIYNFNKGK